jgi:hypothetical protein
MKNASEMRAITNSVNEEKNKAKKANAEKVVSDRICPQILKKANYGGSKVDFYLDADIDLPTVVEILTSNGYGVETRGQILRIRW